MSEEMPIGVVIFEKILGLVLLIIGAVIAYAATTINSGDIVNFSGMFVILGVVVAVAGVLLIVVKGK
ncbi:MAG: hypothetical protein WC325_02095 [Candidatus Bathyarchaeia archaeon]|jgi:ethanolamine utilization microcompartment shell protein EutS